MLLGPWEWAFWVDAKPEGGGKTEQTLVGSSSFNNVESLRTRANWDILEYYKYNVAVYIYRNG